MSVGHSAASTPQDGFVAGLLAGTRSQSWMASFLFHVCLFLILALVLGTVKMVEQLGAAPSFNAPVESPLQDEKVELVERWEPDMDQKVLEVDPPISPPPAQEIDAGVSDSFAPGGGGFDGAPTDVVSPSIDSPVTGIGPLLRGTDRGIDRSHPPRGPGKEGPLGQRDPALRGNFIGPTKTSERAVSGALNWIFRHQNPDGSWSLNHTARCQHGQCSCPSDVQSDAAATALGLLPFLAAGQTHESKGPHRTAIRRGLDWLLAHQKQNGDLSAGGPQMYTHGLATIALCEAYGMTSDSRIGYAAQMALNFIMSGQNQEGGWRYTHGSSDSYMSVAGWQVMALKSGQMAGLQVHPAAMDRARKYIETSASGNYKDRFPYTSKGGATLPMTSVGLLLSQYLGATRESPVVTGGVEYLGQNLPTMEQRNIYSWYYATQAMHNVPGESWDKWNRAMRRLLVDSQEKAGCAAGSWNPQQPTSDAWGKQGGRMMVTSLSCLTLEVYYRHLPLYKLDGKKQ